MDRVLQRKTWLLLCGFLLHKKLFNILSHSVFESILENCADFHITRQRIYPAGSSMRQGIHTLFLKPEKAHNKTQAEGIMKQCRRKQCSSTGRSTTFREKKRNIPDDLHEFVLQLSALPVFQNLWNVGEHVQNLQLGSAPPACQKCKGCFSWCLDVKHMMLEQVTWTIRHWSYADI